MNDQHDKDYRIIVNAREKTVEKDVLTFDEVVDLAPNLPPPSPDVEYKVSFRNAVEPKEGTLIPGESVKI